ncbi:hypothetical protein FOL75_04980 [Bacillus thuringiensis]|uniref:hypothetical protein n=1 Tax=Bacillus thuringiensis TaxID=1428 RepID=UPI002853D066|nr:hypothetical protein [Bacillus thuringiensis]MDR5021421.1 hypothetical protein [Bacillus thuringiensis]
MNDEQKLNNTELEPVPTIVVPVITDEQQSEGSGFFSFKKKKSKVKSQKNKSVKKEKQEKKQKVRVSNQTISILPFVRCEDHHIVLKDGVMDILQITTIDLESLNQSDELLMIYQRVRYIRSYIYDYKEISLNFPANTSVQQEYWQKKREQTRDPIDHKYIDRKLFELKFLEEKRTNREFFLFIYADNQEQLDERRRIVEGHFKTSFPLVRISKEKKKDVLCVLNNQNSKL